MFLVSRLLGTRKVFAAIGAIVLMISPLFWWQSIIAEVYTLHTLLFFATLYLVLDFGATRRPRTLYLLSATYGLSLADHWPLIGLATACLALALLPRDEAGPPPPGLRVVPSPHAVYSTHHATLARRWDTRASRLRRRCLTCN